MSKTVSLLIYHNVIFFTFSSVQFEIFIYTQIIAHDVHYRFEVVIGDVINKLLNNKENTRLWHMPIASCQEKVFCISL